MTGVSLAKQTVALPELAAALAALERGGALTPVSLDLEDPEMNFEAWLGMGVVFTKVRRACKWWIGDWYIFGQYNYSEEKAAAAEAMLDISPHTLASVVRTCMYVPKSRRRLALSFSHHTEVARLMPEEQERFLALAEQYNWTRTQLRDAIQLSRKRFVETQPVWEGAIAMQSQLRIEEIARQLYFNAQPDGDHYKVERELIVRLGAALGEEVEL